LTAQSKVYLEIVQQIRMIMKEDGLAAGDRLPSERDLSVRLNVGRSSVREALRALELVGLIETRRGEGTFIRNYEHGIVQLIAGFVLQDEKTKGDLLQVKSLIERDAIRLLCTKESVWSNPDFENEHAFWKDVFKRTDNHLLYRIWFIVSEYAADLEKESTRELYTQLQEAIGKRDEAEALRLHDALNLSRQL
jgi:DNA-binding transcriptional regulator YhcF (GntR family)